MAKKLTLIGMAVAALAAFALPAAASAAPVLTSEDNPGVPVPVGSTIKGTSTNAKTTGSAVGTLTCEHVEIFGEVTKNNGTGGAEGVGKGGTTTVCHTAPPNQKNVTITAPTLKKLSTTVSGTANIEMTYIAHVGPVECHFEGAGTGTYTTGSDVLKISALKLTATSPLCGGSDITFSGDFTLTTTNGVPVNVSAG